MTYGACPLWLAAAQSASLLLPDQRMQDGLQSGLGAVVGEDQSAHRCPIQPAVRTQHVGAESARDRRHGRPFGSGQLMSDGVGIDQCRTALCKEIGDRALAAADAAGDAHNEAHGAGSPLAGPQAVRLAFGKQQGHCLSERFSLRFGATDFDHRRFRFSCPPTHDCRLHPFGRKAASPARAATSVR
jgi:hypothetical protein